MKKQKVQFSKKITVAILIYYGLFMIFLIWLQAFVKTEIDVVGILMATVAIPSSTIVTYGAKSGYENGRKISPEIITQADDYPV